MKGLQLAQNHYYTGLTHQTRGSTVSINTLQAHWLQVHYITFPVHLLVLHIYLYCTLISAYIKAVLCTILLIKYNTQSYSGQSQSLSLFSTWYQSHLLVAFTRQFFAFLRCYRFMVSSPPSNTILLPLPSSNFTSPSLRSTHVHYHRIDLLKSIRCNQNQPDPTLLVPSRATRSFWISNHVPTTLPTRHTRGVLLL